MFDKQFIAGAIARSSETALDRRRMLTLTGLAGAGAAAAAVAGPAAANAAPASGGVSDATVLNFALNLEYLEAEFYHRAVYGTGLPENLTTGTGRRGGVYGGRKVNFTNRRFYEYAREIAGDEYHHVQFLRAALGSAAVARPTISLDSAFKAAAKAAGLGDGFDPYASDVNFLLAAFVFEDVGVTAYKGASPLITNKTYLEAAAGILAVEAYHAATIRSSLYELGSTAWSAAGKISDARDSLDGRTDLDQGIVDRGTGTALNDPNIVPTDKYGVAFSRTPGQVLNVVYLNPGAVSKGGFFPAGVNGAVRTSTQES
ncbi:ferritin-like domain-containing protein [Amnibacterium sp. CER49]|uniref:ferritin-like domain-containing protein n=1 Tax=Amnibacterium sp. CER49 TaxID=3039161 RepID=UPI0024477125|nr:ferritin-like domain-containing protein [Amnibacterium sp. CER49]MDH2444975.1 ferritin-like domain-containing protein [Amnibacterium sp. CER49]